MMMGMGIRVRGAEQRMSGFGIERTGWSHVHDANDPDLTKTPINVNHGYEPAGQNTAATMT